MRKEGCLLDSPDPRTMQGMAALRTSMAMLGQMVFPRACLGCQIVLPDSGQPWCLDCLGQLMAVTGDSYCRRCGTTCQPHELRQAECQQCRGGRPAIDEFVRVGRYHGLLADLIRRYKFGGQQYLDAPLAGLLAEAITGREWQAELDGVITVPGDWRARWRYRFNPVGLIAAGVGRRLGVPVYSALTVRGKKHRQTELTESLRRENVRGKFQLKKQVRIEGSAVCIVDDVSTTGTTLQVIARLLKEAGAARVYAAVIAKTGENERSFGA